VLIAVGLIVLLVLPEATEGRRRRHKGKKGKADEPTATPNTCVQAVGSPALVDNPDPKAAKALGNAHEGEMFEQTHSLGKDYIVVKNARGGGYTKTSEWHVVPCANAGATTTVGAGGATASPVAPRVASSLGVQAGGIQPASGADAQTSHVCVTPTAKAELRSKADPSGAVLGTANPGEEWEQTEIMASGW
jgi:hypothetical protein